MSCISVRWKYGDDGALNGRSGVVEAAEGAIAGSGAVRVDGCVVGEKVVAGVGWQCDLAGRGPFPCCLVRDPDAGSSSFIGVSSYGDAIAGPDAGDRVEAVEAVA